MCRLAFPDLESSEKHNSASSAQAQNAREAGGNVRGTAGNARKTEGNVRETAAKVREAARTFPARKVRTSAGQGAQIRGRFLSVVM